MATDRGFGDILDELMGATRPKAAPKPEHGVQLHGRTVDGLHYIRTADVVALLEANGVLPKITARLRASL